MALTKAHNHSELVRRNSGVSNDRRSRSIPEPARIVNPVEGSEPSVPRKARLAKLMKPSDRPANQNILYFEELAWLWS
jgi:hypothetical protein